MTESVGQINAASFFGDTALLGTLEAGTVACSTIFTLPSLTTTERDALTAANGMLVYNTSTNTLQGYENGSWVNMR
jgi:hypothetical protein